MNIETVMLICSILVGLGFGSFLNVCIYRLPLEKSIVWPGSACPSCGKALKVYDNIPVLSYLILRGKCRNCKEKISLQYPCVELASAALAVIFYRKFGASVQAAGLFIFAEALLAASLIDLKYQIIPDSISLGGIPIGFLFSFVSPLVNWKESLIGAVVGCGSLLVIAMAYEAATGKEGMGGGDVKLLGTVGAFLGYKAALLVIAVSSLAGAVISIPLMLVVKKNSNFGLPFGPFISGAAILAIFYGNELATWYLSLAQIY